MYCIAAYMFTVLDLTLTVIPSANASTLAIKIAATIAWRRVRQYTLDGLVGRDPGWKCLTYRYARKACVSNADIESDTVARLKLASCLLAGWERKMYWKGWAIAPLKVLHFNKWCAQIDKACVLAISAEFVKLATLRYCLASLRRKQTKSAPYVPSMVNCAVLSSVLLSNRI